MTTITWHLRRNWKCVAADLWTVVRTLNGSLRGKKLAILGYAFKNDTSDTRESQATEAIKLLLAERPLEIAIFDPQVPSQQIQSELAASLESSPTTLNVCSSALEACDKAAAVLVLTEWEQFRYPPRDTPASKTGLVAALAGCAERYLSSPSCDDQCAECMTTADQADGTPLVNVDWSKIAQSMSAPGLVFDGRGMLDPSAIARLGLRLESIGRQSGWPQRW